MRFSEYLRRVQNLPLIKRKIIFWSIIIILGLILCSLYVLSIKHKIKTFPAKKSLEDMKFPDFKEELDKQPKFETEGIENLKDDVKKAEEMIKENNLQE
jgi:hypothetical protein